jgi:hypothetical protein
VGPAGGPAGPDLVGDRRRGADRDGEAVADGGLVPEAGRGRGVDVPPPVLCCAAPTGRSDQPTAKPPADELVYRRILDGG